MKKENGAEEVYVKHEFEPVYNEKSEILILGSFPSVKSREQGFYYGHPQNRFWKIIATLYDEPIPTTLQEKKELLLKNRIAVWDVIDSCKIKGSSDASIKEVVPVPLLSLLAKTSIKQIYANGKTAGKLYKKYLEPITRKEVEVLPSSSPANAAFSLERLVREWKVIKNVN